MIDNNVAMLELERDEAVEALAKARADFRDAVTKAVAQHSATASQQYAQATVALEAKSALLDAQHSAHLEELREQRVKQQTELDRVAKTHAATAQLLTAREDNLVAQQTAFDRIVTEYGEVFSESDLFALLSTVLGKLGSSLPAGVAHVLTEAVASELPFFYASKRMRLGSLIVFERNGTTIAPGAEVTAQVGFQYDNFKEMRKQVLPPSS